MAKKIKSTIEPLITKNLEELHRTIERLTEIMYAPNRTRKLVHQPELGVQQLPSNRVRLRVPRKDDRASKPEALTELLQGPEQSRDVGSPGPHPGENA
jgi:hypothetical protein